jgi:hypothetical protein
LKIKKKTRCLLCSLTPISTLLVRNSNKREREESKKSGHLVYKFPKIKWF